MGQYMQNRTTRTKRPSAERARNSAGPRDKQMFCRGKTCDAPGRASGPCAAYVIWNIEYGSLGLRVLCGPTSGTVPADLVGISVACPWLCCLLLTTSLLEVASSCGHLSDLSRGALGLLAVGGRRHGS